MIEQIEKWRSNPAHRSCLTARPVRVSHFGATHLELKQARHQFSGAFVEVNCATLRGDTAMSTLFGHVKGAFTGARESREGLLRSANGGMLFLDEIGELGADEQAMLLKAIEEKTFYPFGSDRQVSSDFSLSPERCAICASWLPKANFVKTCTRGSISGPSPCQDYANARKILNRTWIMKWGATPHSLATACVLTPKRGVPGWPLRPLPRQHGAVTSRTFCQRHADGHLCH